MTAGYDQFNSSGFFPNLQELGGADTGMLQAVANSLGFLSGSLAPPIAFWLHRRTHGLWSPVYYFNALALLWSGLRYRSLISLQPARLSLTVVAAGIQD